MPPGASARASTSSTRASGSSGRALAGCCSRRRSARAPVSKPSAWSAASSSPLGPSSTTASSTIARTSCGEQVGVHLADGRAVAAAEVAELGVAHRGPHGVDVAGDVAGADVGQPVAGVLLRSLGHVGRGLHRAAPRGRRRPRWWGRRRTRPRSRHAAVERRAARRRRGAPRRRCRSAPGSRRGAPSRQGVANSAALRARPAGVHEERAHALAGGRRPRSDRARIRSPSSVVVVERDCHRRRTRWRRSRSTRSDRAGTRSVPRRPEVPVSPALGRGGGVRGRASSSPAQHAATSRPRTSTTARAQRRRAIAGGYVTFIPRLGSSWCSMPSSRSSPARGRRGCRGARRGCRCRCGRPTPRGWPRCSRRARSSTSRPAARAGFDTSKAWKKPWQSPMSSVSSTITGLPHTGGGRRRSQRTAPVARSTPSSRPPLVPT